MTVPSPSASKPATPEPLITPTFIVAWLVNFFQYLTFYLLVTTMALYAVERFAASDTSSGFASSAFVVGATIARLFSGYVVDAVGRRRVLIISLVAVALISALYLIAGSLPLLIIVRIVHGIGYAFASTAVMTIAQSVIPHSRRAEGTGYLALGSTLATAIGPALGLFLAHSLGYNVMFAVSFGLSAISLLFGFFLRTPKSSGEVGSSESVSQEHLHAERLRFSFGNIADPAVVPIGIFMLLVGLGYSGVITYLNAYSQDRGVVAGAGLFFLAYAAVMLVMRFVLGKLQDRRGDNAVVIPGVIFFTTALILLAIAHSNWMVVLAGVLTGLGYGTLMPAAQAISVKLVPAHKLGTGISTMLLLMDVGLGVGPLALGALVSSAGYGAMYFALAAVVVVAGIYYFFVHGRKQSTESHS